METIEILTQIIRHQNKPANQSIDLFSDIEFDLEAKDKKTTSSIVALNESKAVTDSLKEYLDNLNNAVVNSVSQRDLGSEQEEDEISIQEIVRVGKQSIGK